MSTATEELTSKKCLPCEGGVDPLTKDQAEELLTEVQDWTLSDDGKWIRRKWVAKHFKEVMDFLNKVADVAESEGHHPDIHVVGYRNVTIELTTHAIGGLSENDFIVAAKIDQLPIELKE